LPCTLDRSKSSLSTALPLLVVPEL
jgi:hypothetical protein